MSTTASELENQTFTIREDIDVHAPIEQTFKSLVAQIGRLNETPDGTPLPMVLELHIARDLGAAVHVDRRDLEHDVSPERDAGRHAHQVHPHGRGPIPRRQSPAHGDRVERDARARPQGC